MSIIDYTDLLNDRYEEITKVLEEAASIVERGWCQGQYVTYTQPGEANLFCSSGAIRQASFNYPMEVRLGALEAFRDFLKSSERGSNIPEWNDVPERTKEDVEEAFRELLNERRG